MKTRGSGTPGRAATGRVKRVLNAAAGKERGRGRGGETDASTKAKVSQKKTSSEKGAEPTPSCGGTGELIRAAWHAFPGFLAIWLYRTMFSDRPYRTWRAHPVALALLPLTVACWGVEWLRLTPRFRNHTSRDSNDKMLSPLTLALDAVDAILRDGERRRIHGTAWYLLGVCISLTLYPSDVAVLSVCHLAWWGETSTSLFVRLSFPRTYIIYNFLHIYSF